MKFAQWPLVFAFAMASLSLGCGGSAGPTSSDTPGGAAPPALDKNSAVPGLAVFTCDPPLGTLTLELPCKVGFSPVNEVECAVHTATTSGMLSFLAPLGSMSKNIDVPMDLSAFPVTRTGSIEGLSLSKLEGKVLFFRVDFEPPAFFGQFIDATIGLSGSFGTTCSLSNGLFWAVPGDFL
jgi:hypothetical protein